MTKIDPDLLRRIDELPRVLFRGTAYRHLGLRHSPMAGEGARIRGGRWNPPDSFPVLYMALSQDTVVAEFYRHAERQGMPPENMLPRRFQEYQVELGLLLDLRDKQVRPDLGLTDAVIQSDDPSTCQSVGDAAHYAGFEGIVAPSATGTGEVLAVFTDTLVAGSSIEVGDAEVWLALPDPIP